MDISAPGRTPEMDRVRARLTQRFTEVFANLWYATPPSWTSRVDLTRWRHAVPQLLSGYRLPPRGGSPSWGRPPVGG